MMEPFIPSNDHKTPEESEIPFLRVAKQLGLQRIPQKRKPQYDALPGRPVAVADIPTDRDSIHDMRWRYQEIVQGLSYQEGMALMRAFGKTWSTFLMRKYAHRSPSLEEVIVTIRWFNCGKPIHLNKQHKNIASFF